MQIVYAGLRGRRQLFVGHITDGHVADGSPSVQRCRKQNEKNTTEVSAECSHLALLRVGSVIVQGTGGRLKTVSMNFTTDPGLPCWTCTPSRISPPFQEGG